MEIFNETIDGVIEKLAEEPFSKKGMGPVQLMMVMSLSQEEANKTIESMRNADLIRIKDLAIFLSEKGEQRLLYLKLMKQKEFVLAVIMKNLDNEGSWGIEEPDVEPILKMKPAELLRILRHFENKGFLIIESPGGNIEVSVNQEAFEFIAKGGFKQFEKIKQLELEKLLLEIEALKEQIPESTFNKVTSLVNMGLTVLSLIK